MYSASSSRRDNSSIGSSSNKRALVFESNVEPIRKTARRSVLDVEVATLQAELEHAQSLRQLDAKRFQKELERVQKQLEFAVEETNEAKALMEEVREESEVFAQQQREARLRTQEELREVQFQLDQALVESHVVQEDNSSVWVLQEQLSAKTNENEQLISLIQNYKQELSDQKQDFHENNKPAKETPSLLSKSPPDVLRELNRVRIQLAESERKNRQLQRVAEQNIRLQREILQEQQATKSAKDRVQQVEAQLTQITQQSNLRDAKLSSWKQFGSAIYKLLGESSSQNDDRPPEVHKVQSFLTTSQMAAHWLEQEKHTLQQELESVQKSTQELGHKVNELVRSKVSMQKLLEEEQRQTNVHERQMTVLKGQERVWKRELESLRSIVDTFDALPLDGTSTSQPTGIAGGNPRTLQVQLDFAEEELQVLKDGQESMKLEMEKVLLQKKDLQSTHNTVLEKFGILKDALYAERSKAETAEQRANRAEELAGKGSFNPHTTRVLHLQHNPLTEALKQEVSVLKRQLQTTKEKQPPVGVGSDVDPNKLHQRLKQSFKEQIGRFREGVYLMTGFKIDMIPGPDDRPKFKVRSVFAEQEKDHLMFQWPAGKNVGSLDLLGTELAKSLATTPSYEYISRFHSLPAFLASAQLSLFEKQTMM